ncbi:putative ankyrin repeat-containing protein [Botrytis fragariae]|uniref:Putative ankyrin repeat-containing protein n=1 Tax=Botrytis fragariae TaxID=1964551 RepID=A0A8H6EDT7_9HELO|nr:putative ankyrin repeat-containing protein [Botrytis fragariae]KAF5868486.1 putative ankyrin repeat-containing protein [Botrytis fragariae]
MSRNSDDVLCRVCTVSGDRKECTVAIESIVHKFFGQNAKVIRKKSASGAQNYDYEVQLPGSEAPKAEELQKVHNLCRIKVQALLREIDPLPKSDKGKGIVQPLSSDSDRISQPSATKDRPDTIRIKKIPATYSGEIVEMIVQGEFGSKPKIHSLALHDREHLCATVTFPEEEYGFPTKQLQKVTIARQSRSDAPEIQYDADFLNFTTLYNASPERLQADVDIVAVVGLGTHAFGTFRSTTPGSHEMWLRDFLPKDIPNTRILLYGYPSTVSGGQSMEKVEDIASTFLNRLTLLRRNTSTRNRPIIFIGQSLGGLIVQESLLRAADSRDPYEREIFDFWHGLVGFGIPIAGLNNPSLIEAVKLQPNKVLIGQLCRDRENGTPSAYLIELKHRFESCCKQKEKFSSHAPEVLYFWERHYSQPRTRNGIVGEKILMVEDSATPGARNLPLNSDHSGMVKYSSRSDLFYEDVSSNIEGMVSSLAERRDVVQYTSGNESFQRRGDKIINGPSAPKRRGTFLSEDELETTLA